jgi:hypothetical protein
MRRGDSQPIQLVKHSTNKELLLKFQLSPRGRGRDYITSRRVCQAYLYNDLVTDPQLLRGRRLY